MQSFSCLFGVGSPSTSQLIEVFPLPSDPVGEGIGHFFGAIRVDAFRPASEFKSHMDNWIERFRSAKPTTESPEVLIPGDIERKMQEQRLREGIPLLEPVVKDLEELGQKFSVIL